MDTVNYLAKIKPHIQLEPEEQAQVLHLLFCARNKNYWANLVKPKKAVVIDVLVKSISTSSEALSVAVMEELQNCNKHIPSVTTLLRS